MLVMRPEQMEVFRAAALHSFEHEMLAHLAEFSPPLFRAVGDEQMRKAIRLGMERAGTWGLTLRGPVRLYLDLMLLFGSHFDSDPQYPWAGEILAAGDAGSEMARADRLHARTMDYRRQVAGPEDIYTLTALRNITALARQPLEIDWEDYGPAMRRQIALVYPRKAAYIGDAGVDALVRKGLEGARRQGFSTVRGAILVTVLMLAFGHGCGADPLYPWIAGTLSKDTDGDPDVKARRLEKKALTWLDQVLAHFDDGVPT